MKTYYYGVEGENTYHCTDLAAAIEWYDGDYDEPYEIIELISSKKSGSRCCKHINDFIEECSENNCGNDYEPRNGKNGICKSLTWCLIETGKRFLINPAGGSYKTTSERTEK